MKTWNRIILVGMVWLLAWMVAAESRVLAVCYSNGPTYREDGGCSDSCTSLGSGQGSVGTACYNCNTDEFGYYCMSHDYYCTESCSGSGSGGCTSSSACPSGQCCKDGVCGSDCQKDCNDSYKTWCPSGTTRQSAIVSTRCVQKGQLYWCSYLLGSAQTLGGECNCETIEGPCERHCWTNPNTGKTSCWNECEPDYVQCSGRVVRTHSCTPPCVSDTQTVPVLTAPADGYNSDSMTVTMSWNPVDWGASCSGVTMQYRVRGGSDPNNLSLWYTVAHDGTLSYERTFSNPNGRRVYWQVRAVKINSSGTVVARTDSPLWSFNLPVPISGVVYEKRDELCGDMSTPVYPGLGTTVSRSAASVAVDANAQFSFPLVPLGTNVFTLNLPLDSFYTCACSGGCNKSVDVTGTSNVVNMFVLTTQDAWWQTVGGDVGARSIIRDTAVRTS
jgi:hypothetical protein